MKNKLLSDELNKNYYIVKVVEKPKSFLRKIFPKQIGNAYIWPTDNWVEIHLFQDIYKEIRTYEVDYKYSGIQTGGMEFLVKKRLDLGEQSWVDAEWIVLNNIIKSFILSRKKVFGNKKRIYFDKPIKKDYERWNNWHPKNDHPTEIWIRDTENTLTGSHHGEEWSTTFNLKNQTISTKQYDEGE